MLLGVFTELLSAGGIQRLGRQTAAGIKEAARGAGEDYLLLSLHDPMGDHRFQVDGRNIWISGRGGSTARLAASIAFVAPRLRMVYLAHPHLAPLGVFVKMLRPRAPYWVAGYGIDIWGTLRILERLGLKLAFGLTALSEYTKRQIVSAHAIPPQRIELLPPAVDPALARSDARATTTAPGWSTILCVARLISTDRYKGVDQLIQALPRVLEEAPGTRLVIVGDGDDRSRLEQLSRRLHLGRSVVFSGHVSDEELACHYRNCTLYAMPSSREGLGIVFLEAMAFGKPVIGARHGGTPEIIRDGQTGLLVDPDDIEALAKAILRLLSSPQLRSRMGERAREYVAEAYTYAHFQRRLEAILGRCLSSGTSR